MVKAQLDEVGLAQFPARRVARDGGSGRCIAPSNELRRWYQHAPEKWPEFRRRYFAELDANPAGVAALKFELGRGVVTLVFGSKETKLNNATAMREYLEANR